MQKKTKVYSISGKRLAKAHEKFMKIKKHFPNGSDINFSLYIHEFVGIYGSTLYQSISYPVDSEMLRKIEVIEGPYAAALLGAWAIKNFHRSKPEIYWVS